MWYGTGSGSQDTFLHKPPQAAFIKVKRESGCPTAFECRRIHEQDHIEFDSP